MGQHLKRKLATVIALVVVGVLAGPFDTYSDLGMAGRLVYWSIAVVGIGFFMNVSITVALDRDWPVRLPRPALLFAASVVAALPGSLLIRGLETALRGHELDAGTQLRLWGVVAVIGFVVALSETRTFPVAPASGPTRQPAPTPKAGTLAPRAAAENGGPIFLRNLGPDLGEDLVSLTTDDHYLEVVTRQGRGKILKRMSDAVAELDGYPGMQIHRSHWVALDAIARLERDGRRMQVVLVDGRTLPVSRPNAPGLEKAWQAHQR